MSNWVVGWNMPGYLPESDPWITDNWEAARDSLLWDIETHYDQDGDIPVEDQRISEAEYEEAIASLKALSPGEEWSWSLGNLVYWLSITNEEPEEDE